LFYVALTRAKQTVWLLANSSRPSTFIDELIEEEEYEVEVSGELPYSTGKCSKCGGRMLRKRGNGNPYFVCEFGKLFGNRSPVCSKCGSGLPTRRESSVNKMSCSCGATHPVCSSCGQGWLIEREGPYGKFMGCSRYPDCRRTGRR
jgi:DNA helicase-4